MKFISRFICMVMVMNLMAYSAGVTPAAAAISMSPKNAPLSELGQGKKIDPAARATAESALPTARYVLRPTGGKPTRR